MLILRWCALLPVLVSLTVLSAHGQEKKDTARNSIINNRITREILQSIKTNPDTVFNKKAEEEFLPFEGKIIRNINIHHIGFERSFYGTRKKVAKRIVEMADALHGTTKRSVIQNNLFIRKNKPLNPYRVADNERYLRDLEFLLDAKIDARAVGKDSVDLFVTTRDVFSLGAPLEVLSTTEYSFGIFDANLAGLGQRVAFNALIDADREPNFGYEFIYAKNSIGGTLINGSVGYTRINTGSSYGIENENAVFMKFDRPLVSPYTRMAGGMEWSRNWSENVFTRPDSLFLDYKYHIYDLWAGYNIGVNNLESRGRHFLALRWFHQDFKTTPEQSVVADNPDYNDNSFLLAEFTFFRQNFYKTRFIYGFGRTEDVPYGHSASIAVGRVKQLNRERTYMSGGVTRKMVNNRGDFYEMDVRGATFLNNGKSEDATLLFSSSWFSHLLTQKNFKIRQYVKASYAIELNPTINELLRIGNDFGVRGFRTDSLFGEQRLGLTSETVFFTKWKFLGFNFAPLLFVDLAFLPPVNENIFYDKPYAGLGAGIRTRNENIVLGTVELRFTYYPKVTENISHFNVNVSYNLRVKYTDSFVRAPGFLRFN